MDIREFVLSVNWRFAKTMPKDPHWYTVRNFSDDAAFIEAVNIIRRDGKPVMYKGRAYISLDLDGWRYWTMGNPLPQTKIINRARF